MINVPISHSNLYLHQNQYRVNNTEWLNNTNGNTRNESRGIDRGTGVEKMYLDCEAYSFLFEDLSFFGPPRIREICRPLLNAWLKSIRVWSSDTRGSQAKNATGANISKPMIISETSANVRTDPQTPAQ